MKKVCSEVLETTRLISLIFPRNIFPTYYKNDKYKVNSTKKKKGKAQELKHLVTSTKQKKRNIFPTYNKNDKNKDNRKKKKKK